MTSIGERRLECSLCAASLKDPKQLSCGDVFCHDCLNQFHQCQTGSMQLFCPVCSKVALLKDSTKPKASGKPCAVCGPEKDSPAYAVCTTCSVYLCQPCMDTHKKNKSVKHRVSRIRIQPNPKYISNGDGEEDGSARLGGKRWSLESINAFKLRGSDMWSLNPTRDGKMLVGYLDGGVEVFTLDGPQGLELEGVKVMCICVLPDGRYVVRDINNKLQLYTPDWSKLGVYFTTDEGGGYGGMGVDRNGYIYVGYWRSSKISVYRPIGGSPLKDIPCHGYEPWDICPMNNSKHLVVSGGSMVGVVDSNGKVKHDITKEGANAYPAVLVDDSVLVGWDKDGLLSIDLYTKNLSYVRSVFTDFTIENVIYNKCCLREFSSGEFAFCDFGNFNVFHKSDTFLMTL